MANPVDILLVSEEDAFLPYEMASPLERYIQAPIRDVLEQKLPPLPHMQHLGIVTLATYLRHRGFSVRVIDNIFRIPANWNLFRQILSERPLAVGISTSLLLSRTSLQRIIGEVRKADSRIPVILGGRTAQDQSWTWELADIVVTGAGEQTLFEILTRLKTGGDLGEVPNLHLWREGRLLATPIRRNLEPDRIPPPDWDMLPIRPSACYPIEASKGCRYNCAFCSYADRGRQEIKSIDLVVEEVERNWERYGISLYRFMDSNFTSWPEKTEELCRRLMETKIPLQWSCYARVDDLASRSTLAQAMSRAGCQAVFLGIESGDDSVLRSMRKGYAVPDIIEGARLAKSAGLITHGNFVIGFPGETAGTVRNTLRLLEILSLDMVNFVQLILVSDSDAQIALQPARWGLVGSGPNWRHATMSSDEAAEHVRECFDFVTTQLEDTVIGEEMQNFAIFSGWGLRSEEIMDFLGGIRDYHRGLKNGDDALHQRARALVGRYAARLYRNALGSRGFEQESRVETVAP